ncbi:MAG: hypothetical protein H0T76_07350 [Nannocystis sp.]|nr:hypothetical protein [Nannocystis sp.]MBA3546279.1 hypothetical protein [Nannocystis sp.]
MSKRRGRAAALVLVFTGCKLERGAPDEPDVGASLTNAAASRSLDGSPPIVCRRGGVGPPRREPPPARELDRPAGCDEILGRADLEGIRRVIHGRHECYRRCGESGAAWVGGRVLVSIVIAQGLGVVRYADVEDVSGISREVAECVADEILALEFPAPACGDFTIRYPLEFVSGP